MSVTFCNNIKQAQLKAGKLNVNYINQEIQLKGLNLLSDDFYVNKNLSQEVAIQLSKNF